MGPGNILPGLFCFMGPLCIWGLCHIAFFSVRCNKPARLRHSGGASLRPMGTHCAM
jgi:hypothetical protein